jgi:hypothetical protein
MPGLQSWKLIILAAVLPLIASSVTHAQKYSVLYNFGIKSADPAEPYHSGIVAQGRDGNLYSIHILCL